jgi:hypothetical protein
LRPVKDGYVSIAGKRKAGNERFNAAQADALDYLAGHVIGAKVNREAVEDELDRLPRWRFIRRVGLEREVDRRRRREQELLGLVKEV